MLEAAVVGEVLDDGSTVRAFQSEGERERNRAKQFETEFHLTPSVYFPSVKNGGESACM